MCAWEGKGERETGLWHVQEAFPHCCHARTVKSSHVDEASVCPPLRLRSFRMVCACICLSLLCAAVTALPHSNHCDFQCRHTHIVLCIPSCLDPLFVSLSVTHTNTETPRVFILRLYGSVPLCFFVFWYLQVRLPFIWEVNICHIHHPAVYFLQVSPWLSSVYFSINPPLI